MNSDYVCQKCHRPLAILEALGKVKTNQGYLQCTDCYSDLEYESTVVRDIHLKRKHNEGIPLPEWYQKELDVKGLGGKVDMGKYLSGEEMAAIKWAAKIDKRIEDNDSIPLDKWMKMSQNKRIGLILGKNNSKLKKAIKEHKKVGK